MARVEFSGIPGEFEATRSFEVHDPTDSELKALRERVFGTDIEAELGLYWAAAAAGGESRANYNPLASLAPIRAATGVPFAGADRWVLERRACDYIKEEVVTRYRTAKG